MFLYVVTGKRQACCGGCKERLVVNGKEGKDEVLDGGGCGKVYSDSDSE